jgi:hypothetical protein
MPAAIGLVCRFQRDWEALAEAECGEAVPRDARKLMADVASSRTTGYSVQAHPRHCRLLEGDDARRRAHWREKPWVVSPLPIKAGRPRV